MVLKILGSSSAGNCYILDNGKEALLIECGVDYREIQKAVDFDTSRVVGVLVSHEHGDHSKHIRRCLQSRIPCYMSSGTATALGLHNVSLVHTIKPHQTCRLGGFSVQAFDVQHDAVEPLGYLIRHSETGTILFATDTYYLKYRFRGLNNILIECNYDPEILSENMEAGRIAKAQRDRTLKSHMSYETCKTTLLANDLSEVNNIVLIHLSPSNSNAVEFERGIREATGKSVIIADKGTTIEFNKTPF